MKIEIAGRHVEITEELRAHVLAEAEQIQDHVSTWAMNLHVILTVEQYKEKENKKAEGILALKNHKELVASDVNADLYTAISNMFRKLHQQALKYKAKHLGHQE